MKTIFLILLTLSSLYADVVIGDGNIERLSSPVIKDINCQNYTVKVGGLLDTSNGGTLREVTQLEINGEWDFGTGQIKELGGWINNGTVAAKPTQTGSTPNLEFTTICGPISILGSSDTDGDGISDADEGDNAVALGHGITLDQDGDGIYNFLDEDSDNDGISDIIEGGNDIDADEDGIPDYLDTEDSRPDSTDDSSMTGNTIGDTVSIDILANDTLNNGDTAAADDVNVTLIAPSNGIRNDNGSITVEGEGTWTYNTETGMLAFVPLNGFTGDPTPITYTLTEIDSGLIGEPSAVHITYDDALVAPVAKDDNVSGNIQGEDVVINILSGDALGNGTEASAAAVIVVLQAPENGIRNADGSITVANEGTWGYDANTGMLTFSPKVGFTGNPAPLSYILTDKQTGLTDTAIVTVSYAEPFIAVDDGIVTIGHYGTNVVNVLGNDKYNGTVLLQVIQNPEYGSVEVVEESDGRVIILYTPLADINQITDTFRYSITDAKGKVSEAEVTLKIACASSQTSDGGDALSKISMLAIIFLTGLVGLYFVRREEVA